MIVVFAGFLAFLFCLYFIKNPYFTLQHIKIKRSKSLLISELLLGVIIFLYIIFAGYSRLVRFLLELISVILFLSCSIPLKERPVMEHLHGKEEVH